MWLWSGWDTSKMFKSILVNLATSKSISYFWNLGSLLGMIFLAQSISGFLLLFYYSNDAATSFMSVNYLMMESKWGWFMRIWHFNGASLFFIFVFGHFFKAVLNYGYRLKSVWTVGLVILIVLMLEAFTGYCLVWAQMSFWASVVITSLLSVVPVFGVKAVLWVWGGFSVSAVTLKFFFALHYLLPFVLILLIMTHLLFLHETGSTSKLYMHSNFDKILFYDYYWAKDALNILVFMFYLPLVLLAPFKLGDPEMFIEADFLVSPTHIVPEWYFLFAYAILRAIPNKVLGVVCLLASLLVWLVFLTLKNKSNLLDLALKSMSVLFIINGIFISWLGQCLVESPFVALSMMFSLFYFFMVFSIFLVVSISRL